MERLVSTSSITTADWPFMPVALCPVQAPPVFVPLTPIAPPVPVPFVPPVVGIGLVPAMPFPFEPPEPGTLPPDPLLAEPPTPRVPAVEEERPAPSRPLVVVPVSPPHWTLPMAISVASIVPALRIVQTSKAWRQSQVLESTSLPGIEHSKGKR